jgi:hypothetical protein
LQKSTSSLISLKSSGLMPTIMYMAAELLIGLTPSILDSLSNAASELVFNFYFKLTKWSSLTSVKILGREA